MNRLCLRYNCSVAGVVVELFLEIGSTLSEIGERLLDIKMTAMLDNEDHLDDSSVSIADLVSFFGQVIHHPAAAAAEIVQVEDINPGHDPQDRCPHRCVLVIEGGPRDLYLRTLVADDQLGMFMVGQLVQFTVTRIAEIFGSHSSSICSRSIRWNSSASWACPPLCP